MRVVLFGPGIAPEYQRPVRGDGHGGRDHRDALQEQVRPAAASQLEPALRPLLDVPGHPSYPSGHATQAYLVAQALTTVIRNHEIGRELYKIAERVAVNREWAGLHYASDSAAGKQLAREVFPVYRGRLPGNLRRSGARVDLTTAADQPPSLEGITMLNHRRIERGDPATQRQWHLHTSDGNRLGIDAVGAWGQTCGQQEVKVVVFDTGVDIVHPNLRPNIELQAARDFDHSLEEEVRLDDLEMEELRARAEAAVEPARREVQSAVSMFKDLADEHAPFKGLSPVPQTSPVPGQTEAKARIYNPYDAHGTASAGIVAAAGKRHGLRRASRPMQDRAGPHHHATSSSSP